MATMMQTNQMLIDLRNGAGYAISRLSLLSEEVEHLVINYSDPLLFELKVYREDLEDIFYFIGCISHLKGLTLMNFEDENAPISIQSLAELLFRVPELKMFSMESSRIAGNDADVEVLSEAFMTHPSLEEICLAGIHAEASIYMEPLGRAIAKVPSLQVVEIVETSFPPSGIWTGASLAALCRSETLKVLRVRGVRYLMDKDVVEMAEALQHNRAIKELWLLVCELGFQGTGAMAMGKMLQVNTSLEVLGMSRLCFNEHAIFVADGLKDNKSLKALHLHLRDGRDCKIQLKYADVVSENYSLEKMTGGIVRDDVGASLVEFYLRLNRNHRKVLLQNDNCDKKRWLEALESQSDDVSALFYLLSRKPSLCQAAF